MTKELDAKIYAIIDDLSRGSLMELLGIPLNEEHSHYSLTQEVRAGYEAGSIDGDFIMNLWEDEIEDQKS